MPSQMATRNGSVVCASVHHFAVRVSTAYRGTRGFPSCGIVWRIRRGRRSSVYAGSLHTKGWSYPDGASRKGIKMYNETLGLVYSIC